MVRRQQPPIKPEVKETPKPYVPHPGDHVDQAFDPTVDEDSIAQEEQEAVEDNRPRAKRREDRVNKNGHKVWATNDVVFEGYLGADPELNVTTNEGVAVTRIRLALWQGKDKPSAWITGICWRELAEEVERDYQKGDKLRIYGHLTQREWTDREGRKRVTDEYVFDVCEYVEPRR